MRFISLWMLLLLSACAGELQTGMIFAPESYEADFDEGEPESQEETSEPDEKTTEEESEDEFTAATETEAAETTEAQAIETGTETAAADLEPETASEDTENPEESAVVIPDINNCTNAEELKLISLILIWDYFEAIEANPAQKAEALAELETNLTLVTNACVSSQEE